MKVLRPKTLFARTGLTVAAALFVFLLFSSAIMVYYLVVPMARQATEDLAGLMVLSAQTWVELPPDTRPDFVDELFYSHGLTLKTPDTELSSPNPRTPYMRFLEEALAWRLEQEISIKTSFDDQLWLWVDVPMSDRTLRLGFPHERIGVQPPLAALLLIMGGILVTLLTSLLLVRRLTQPLARLSDTAQRFGKGETPAPLSEQGPTELAALARRFNQMMQQIRELHDNRITLLAGISHDLRTPISRMHLALEMLRNDQDPQLISRLGKDLNEMDQLIGRTLEFARGLDAAHSPAEKIELNSMIGEVIADYQVEAKIVEWTPGTDCPVQANTIALRRILMNLIENAVRYGDNKPVTVQCECSSTYAEIVILNRGPGIPEDQQESVFQPFHRVEASRSRATGGSGLGLAIVHQLCEAHGWQIQLLSREGGGVRVNLQIPLNH